ncbi:MAG TPA: response regulator [Burkholderiales bacterium]
MATIHTLTTQHDAKRRVLVVEDNLDSVHSMATLLKMMGHQVEFAINGFAALDVARRFRPEVVLLDIGLPDFKGYDIARQLKWEPGFERTRIIALTGRPMDEVRQKALDAGCEQVFAKPIAPAVLEELLAGGAGPALHQA